MSPRVTVLLLALASLLPDPGARLGPVETGAPTAQAVRQASAELLDAATRATVVEDVAGQLESGYVFPEIGARMAAALRDHLEAGKYEEITDRQRFADLLTAHLNEVASDRHLRILASGAFTNTGGRRAVRAPVDDDTAAGAPATPPDPREVRLDDLPDEVRAALTRLVEIEGQRNHHFTAVQVLPGNIGYVDYDQFGFLPASRDTADAAMLFLAETDAIILDLRGNGGGMEGMNQYLSSYFFGSEPVHLYSRESPRQGGTSEYFTWPEEPRRHFPDSPLYILVDGATGSAAENLSFALQGLGRATIVGEPTAGGAHSSTPVALAGGFEMVLPIARAFNPRTGADWEGVGVQPDIVADPADALLAAHTAAVERLTAMTDDQDRISALEDARLMFAARHRNSADAETLPLDDYAGDFGIRRFWVEDGVLKLVRTDNPAAPELDLLNLGPDLFALERVPSARIAFERDANGTVARVRVLLPTGTWEVSERTQN